MTAPAPAPAIDLGLPPGVVLAPKGRRIGAYFLAFPLAIITLGIGYVIWGLIAWGKGTTPALQVLGMKVWSVNDRQKGPPSARCSCATSSAASSTASSASSR